jgi:hypothetical protein
MSEAKEHSANGRPGHETRDVSVGNLAAFGLILLGLIILGSLVSWVVRNYLYARQSLGPVATPFENVRQEPPANRPELQTRPAEELVQSSERQRQALASYGWVDEKAGVARIPIGRAMEILVQRGFPTTAAASSERNATAAGAKKSGRKP